MKFGKFLIPKNSIFFRSKKSAAFVNLRPIVPGHVLVMPERIVATMDGLTEEEYVDMWKSVRIVQTALRQCANPGEQNEIRLYFQIKSIRVIFWNSGNGT